MTIFLAFQTFCELGIWYIYLWYPFNILPSRPKRNMIMFLLLVSITEEMLCSLFQGLLKAFLQNLSSSSAVVRRTAASSIVTVCLNCRKPHVFISYILNTLLG